MQTQNGTVMQWSFEVMSCVLGGSSVTNTTSPLASYAHTLQPFELLIFATIIGVYIPLHTASLLLGAVIDLPPWPPSGKSWSAVWARL